MMMIAIIACGNTRGDYLGGKSFDADLYFIAVELLYH